MPRLSCFLRTLLMGSVLLSAGCEIRDQAPQPQGLGSAEPAGDRWPAAGLPGGQIAFVEGFERGFQMARDEQKPMLLFFTAQWCKYCHQMAKEAFAEEAVVALSRDFVCVLIDADAEPQACRQFEVRSFPTIQFVSSRGMRLNRVTGKQPAQQLVTQMKAALQAVARREQTTAQR
ncbi:MAG TPA: thioredoxin family protein [Pirellulales bacterium]|nr:thioredoxin family protein [Pirellulales bacterium]